MVHFPGRSELAEMGDPIIGVRSENVTAAEVPKRLAKQALTNAQRLATARYWLTEVALGDIEPIGKRGHRWRVDGVEYRIDEALHQDHEDPRESGCEYFFVDRAGAVHYLRKPRGLDSGQGVDRAAYGGRVAGNLLISKDGTRRLR